MSKLFEVGMFLVDTFVHVTQTALSYTSSIS